MNFCLKFTHRSITTFEELLEIILFVLSNEDFT